MRNYEVFEKLELPYTPVAVKFSMTKPADLPLLDKKLALCEMLREAQMGAGFYADTTSHACGVGPYVLGQKEDDPGMIAGMIGPRIGVYEDTRANRNVYVNMPTFAKGTANYTWFSPLKDCTFKDLGYPIYAWGGYEALTVENCVFENIKSWAIMPQSGFDGDLTVTNCQFTNCLGGGLIKAGTLTAGHTFTFTDNTVTGCTIAGDHNWFQFNASAGTVVMSGNTMDGAAWTPGVAEGLK